MPESNLFLFPLLVSIVIQFGEVKGNCFTQDNDYVNFHSHGYIADDYAVRGLKDFHINQIFSAEACQEQCQLDPDCQFWVWNSPSYPHGNINTCWLKASNEMSRESKGKISGPKNGCVVTTTVAPTTTPAPNNPGGEAPDTDVDCSRFYLNDTAVGRGPGNGVGTIPNIQDVESCRKECARRPTCHFFIWNSHSARKKKLLCIMKKNNKNSETGDKHFGRISGPVTCDVEEAEEHEKNVENEDGVVDCSDLFQENKAVGRGRGNGIPGGRRNNIQSAEDCQAECQKVPECNFFIWNSPSARRKKLSCWLKKNDNNPRNDRGRISGPREC